MIRQHGGEWVLYARDGSRVLGRHSSPERARRQEAAIMVNRHMGKTGQAEFMAEDLARVARVAAPDLIEFIAKYKGRKMRQAQTMKKQSDLAEVNIPRGLFYEAASGEPAAVADIKRIEEAQAKKVFGGGSGSSMFGKAFLGRTRSPGAALSSREEKIVDKFPQLRQLSAGANPERAYTGARAATHPGLVAIPTAGIGALTARLLAQAFGAEGAGRELATAGGAALGGLAGSVGAHALRQRHARKVEQYMRAHEPPPEKIGSLNGVLPFFMASLEKVAIGWPGPHDAGGKTSGAPEPARPHSTIRPSC